MFSSTHMTATMIASVTGQVIRTPCSRCHGQGIARAIQRQSEGVFFVDHGSLYLALQRLEEKRWISAKWGRSENNRKARFYSLTAKGRAQLVEKTSQWRRLARAIGTILGPVEQDE